MKRGLNRNKKQMLQCKTCKKVFQEEIVGNDLVEENKLNDHVRWQKKLAEIPSNGSWERKYPELWSHGK